MADKPLPHASVYHAPVMVDAVLEVLAPERGGVYLDGTLGGGGHTEAILTRSATARVIAVDQDPDALAEAGARLAGFGERVRIVRSNFADAVEAAALEQGTLAGVLLDLGISSHQIDEAERGFTFRPGAPLDMRMAGRAGAMSAADLLNTADEAELADIFWRYGEERRSRRLARVLVEMRERAPLATSDDLIAAIHRSLGPRPTVQDHARIFQALRIAVNREIEVLKAALPRLRDALAPGGVFAVLAYHSLEDRLVKESFRSWSIACTCPPGLPICLCGGTALGALVLRKPLFASADEVARNPRARSARLRAWRRA